LAGPAPLHIRNPKGALTLDRPGVALIHAAKLRHRVLTILGRSLL
jgi:hypothetical protein